MAMRKIRVAQAVSLRSEREHHAQISNLRYRLLLAFRFTGGSGSHDAGIWPRIALTNARCLAAQLTQVIKLGAPHVAFFHYVDVIDDGRMQRKDSFDADAKARLAHGNRFARAAMLASDADAFKCLQSLFGFRFLDPDVNANSVARLKFAEYYFVVVSSRCCLNDS